MQFSFTTDDPAEAADILEMLNGQGRDVRAARPSEHKPAERRKPADDDWPDDGDAPDDPWADDASEKPAEARRGQKSRGPGDDKQAMYDALPRPGVPHKLETPNGDRYWTFEADDAPTCKCGLIAARQTPTAKPSAKGFKWVRWACPLSYSKDTYKSKCDFSEFADKE